MLILRAAHEYRGPAAIGAFLRARRGGARDRCTSSRRVNSQPGYACYLAEPGATIAGPAGSMVVTGRCGRITRLARFHDNAVLSRFGLVVAGGITSAG